MDKFQKSQEQVGSNMAVAMFMVNQKRKLKRLPKKLQCKEPRDIGLTKKIIALTPLKAKLFPATIF